MKAVVEMKTKDFDGFVANMRAMADGESTGGGATGARTRETGGPS